MNGLFSPDLAGRLKRAHSIVAFTGAGMSAESGVPTFRGNQGIWTKFRPEELANLDAFLRNPKLVWEWYSARQRIMADAKPHAGHRSLAEMERLFPLFTVVTQNIDNLHRRAGSIRVLELHGNIEHNYCLKCGSGYRGSEVTQENGRPVCRKCGGLVRPDVVWFGEQLPAKEWNDSSRAMESADIVLCIGTSGVVYPAADLPLVARNNGGYLVEINTEASAITGSMDEVIQGSAAAVLPELMEVIRKERGSGAISETV